MKVLNAIAITLVCIGMLGVNMKAQASEDVLTAKEKSMISISLSRQKEICGIWKKHWNKD